MRKPVRNPGSNRVTRVLTASLLPESAAETFPVLIPAATILVAGTYSSSKPQDPSSSTLKPLASNRLHLNLFNAECLQLRRRFGRRLNKIPHGMHPEPEARDKHSVPTLSSRVILMMIDILYGPVYTELRCVLGSWSRRISIINSRSCLMAQSYLRLWRRLGVCCQYVPVLSRLMLRNMICILRLQQEQI